ncbi:hypothetical protein [Isoptericola nanjingensis]|uniref:hypothetical protein n=1 Tax=Isoptericola nanjingensis TaxID=903413 RepID=UPI003D213C87
MTDVATPDSNSWPDERSAPAPQDDQVDDTSAEPDTAWRTRRTLDAEATDETVLGAWLGAGLDDAAPDADALPTPAEPVDWRTLSADDARTEWQSLDTFVRWLRTTYGLPPAILPPLWHRHPELVWELSALHTHWLACYEPGSSGSGPIAWHADFADARERLREWVSTSGTHADRDRPTRISTWPGEPPTPSGEERPILDRDADFAAFVEADVQARHSTHEAVHPVDTPIAQRHAPGGS